MELLAPFPRFLLASRKKKAVRFVRPGANVHVRDADSVNVGHPAGHAVLNPLQEYWVEAKTVLRDYINATVGFNELAEVTHHSPKSLMRMLGPSGNPQARNLFAIVRYLQRKEGVSLKVRAAAAAG